MLRIDRSERRRHRPPAGKQGGAGIGVASYAVARLGEVFTLDDKGMVVGARGDARAAEPEKREHR